VRAISVETGIWPCQSKTVLRLLVAAALLVCAAACEGFPLTPPGVTEACPGALAEGRLANDGNGNAILIMAPNRRQPVQWPEGYSVDPGPPIQLYDRNDHLVAEEGDVVYAGGGFTEGDELFIACGFVSQDPP
jgi:hypothetical protein